MFGKFFEKTNDIITDIVGVSAALSQQGYQVETMPSRVIDQATMTRVRAKRGDSNFIVGHIADPPYFVFMEGYRLSGRFDYDSMQDWNAKFQFASYTHFPEGDIGILKHNMTCEYGVTEVSLKGFFKVWGGLMSMFRKHVGLSLEDRV